MSRFRISSCSGNYGRQDLFLIVERLASLGFDAVEITTMYHTPPGETPAERRRDIVRRVRDAGLTVNALHYLFLPGMSLTTDDVDVHRKTFDHARSVVDLAHDLDTRFAVVGAGFARSVAAGVPEAEARSRVIDGFGAMAAYAETRGITICFEGLNRYETNVGRTLAECCGYVADIGSPALKVAGDTFHMNIEESSLTEAVRMAGDRLAHFHLADSHRMAPGGGHIDFAPILRALEHSGYGGVLSFEFFWIAPFLPHLATFEQCDAEVAKAIRHIRALA